MIDSNVWGKPREQRRPMGRPPICLSGFLAAGLKFSKETLPKFTVFYWLMWLVLLTSGLPLGNGYLS